MYGGAYITIEIVATIPIYSFFDYSLTVNLSIFEGEGNFASIISISQTSYPPLQKVYYSNIYVISYYLRDKHFILRDKHRFLRDKVGQTRDKLTHLRDKEILV